MPTATARVPAKRASTKKPKPAPDSDVEVIDVDEDAGTFTARLFAVDGDDGVFEFWSDVNFMVLLIAYGGEGEDLGHLSTVLKSIFKVDDDAHGAATWSRFVSLLSKQRGMNAERSMKFINDLVAAAGKDQAENAAD